MLIYDDSEDYRRQIQDYWNSRVKSFRTTTLVSGIIMLVLGVLCLFFPVESILAMEIIASIFLIVLGIKQIADYTQLPVFMRLGGGVLTGVLNILLGIILLSSGGKTMMFTYAWLFAIELLTVGIESIAVANRMKFYGIQDTGYMTANGVLAIIGAVILMFMPQASVAVSYVAAIYLIITGIELLVLFSHAKELKITD